MVLWNGIAGCRKGRDTAGYGMRFSDGHKDPLVGGCGVTDEERHVGHMTSISA
jgi:hypothetical protein